MENGKYVALLYKYDAVKIGDLFVILHVHNKFLSNKKKGKYRNSDGYNFLCSDQGIW